MATTTINLRPKVKINNAYGRKMLIDVYYRVAVREYVNYLSNSTEEVRQLCKDAEEAFFSECVALLGTEGWKLENDYVRYSSCPQMTKGDQYLYCHPQSISGNVKSEDVEALREKIEAMQSCEWEGMDVRGNVIITSSVDDTMQLYRQTYDTTIQETLRYNFATKRRNLYYSLEGMMGRIAQGIHIKISNGKYESVEYSKKEMPYGKIIGEGVADAYVREKVGEMIAQGYIKTTVINRLPHARWINKTEERELRRRTQGEA